jgi:hypothetical protein
MKEHRMSGYAVITLLPQVAAFTLQTQKPLESE